MAYFIDLLPVVADRIEPPVCVALGPPRPVAHLVAALGGIETVCWQLDLHQAGRLRDELSGANAPAEVVTNPDLWDLPARFRTVVFPAAAQTERELKIDMVEQAYHVLVDGGKLVTLSEYEKDSLFAGWHKKVFGKCGESPAGKTGTAFWSARTGVRPRRRHEVAFHAKLPDGPSCSFVSRPGVFGYGRMDHGARALLEVADVQPEEHILDMGCGVGTVGVLAGKKTGAPVTFVDSNVRATALAELNARANGLADVTAVASATFERIPPATFDCVLANPPYYANSEIARRFVAAGRDLLKPSGRFVLVTKVPREVVPAILDAFGDCGTAEARGYTVCVARQPL
jgi:16S rRNA (guanine1207-N2)-methyltransferase